MMRWLNLSAEEIAQAVVGQRVSAVAVTLAALDRLEAIDTQTNALSFLAREQALEDAHAIDQSIERGQPMGPLAGVPVVVKDNIVVSGQPCTCGSKILSSYIGTYDASVIERLRGAGAVLVGRSNMDEFAMGSTTENCAFGRVANPWDTSCVPGGSSGGSAAVLAAGGVPLALGSETGGSVRQPAAFTGLVGLKPTYGRVSRRGLVAYASSTDQVSPMARTVRDAALLGEVIAGHDVRDSTSLNEDVPRWRDEVDGSVAGLKLGLPKQMLSTAVDEGVRGRLAETMAVLEKEGAEIVPVELPSLDLAVACYYVLAPAEASSNLARFDGVRYGRRVAGETALEVYMRSRSQGFGKEVKRRIMMGTYVLSAGYVDAYYHQALKVRRAISVELNEALELVDGIIGPTTPTTAFRFGQHSTPLSMYLTDLFTIPACLAELPAISVPCGLVDGLPVGFQIMARRFDESMCFRVAGAVERLMAPLHFPFIEGAA